MTKAKLMWNYVKLMLAHPPYEPLEEPLADRHLHHGSRRHVPRRALDGPPHLGGVHALVHARPHLLHRVVGRRADREERLRVGAELGALARPQMLPRQRGQRRPLRLRRDALALLGAGVRVGAALGSGAPSVWFSATKQVFFAEPGGFGKVK